MMRFDYKRAASAFTLIELLIVVAIIAILAAIAVPNFLEAQTRAKISRCAADMRSIRTGLETYKIDTNKYPETDYGAGVAVGSSGAGMDRLTTPISYLSTVPKSPFNERKIGGSNYRHCTARILYLYVNAKVAERPIANSFSPTADANGYDTSYQLDRVVYILSNGGTLAQKFAERSKGFWELKSVGPNNIDDFDPSQTGEPSSNARPYDATNGTVSRGDVVVFSDTFDFAGR